MPAPRRGPLSSTGREAGRTVVWLRGEHDESTAADLSAALARAIALDDADLVLDLSEIDCMGAATLHVLARARTFLRHRARTLSLRSPSASARRALDGGGLVWLVESGPVAEPALTATDDVLATWAAVPATARIDLSAAATGRDGP